MGGWVGGWSETDNRAISVQLNLTGTATGTELGNNFFLKLFACDSCGCKHTLPVGHIGKQTLPHLLRVAYSDKKCLAR